MIRMLTQTKTGIYLILVLYYLLVFALIEWGMSIWFGDDLPLWKILAVSLITAIMSSQKILKLKNIHQLKQVFNYQKRVYTVDNQFDLLDFKTEIEQMGYQIKQTQPNQLKFRSKRNWLKSGIVFTANLTGNQLTLKSKPVLFTHLIDEHFRAHEEMEKLGRLLNG